jgi:vacuolar-type H+-ATPase subunit F/Vma7
MITLIGTSTTTIGFGLCGLKDIYEVWRSTPIEEIAKIIFESENEIIMIDEDIYNKIEHLLDRCKKTIIKIPFRYQEEISDDIDELMKDTLGVSIEESKM